MIEKFMQCDVCKKDFEIDFLTSDEIQNKILCHECMNKEYAFTLDIDGFHPIIIEAKK